MTYLSKRSLYETIRIKISHTIIISLAWSTVPICRPIEHQYGLINLISSWVSGSTAPFRRPFMQHGPHKVCPVLQSLLKTYGSPTLVLTSFRSLHAHLQYEVEFGSPEVVLGLWNGYGEDPQHWYTYVHPSGPYSPAVWGRIWKPWGRAGSLEWLWWGGAAGPAWETKPNPGPR